MKTIHLTPETVALAKEILYSGFDGKFPPFIDCFVISEKCTAKHELFEQYVLKTGCSIPKVFIYIIMQQAFGPVTGKDEKGNAGYHLTLNPKL